MLVSKGHRLQTRLSHTSQTSSVMAKSSYEYALIHRRYSSLPNHTVAKLALEDRKGGKTRTLTIGQRARSETVNAFGLVCALQVHQNKGYNNWNKRYIRSRRSTDSHPPQGGRQRHRCLLRFVLRTHRLLGRTSHSRPTKLQWGPGACKWTSERTSKDLPAAIVLGDERLLVEGGVGKVQLAARRLGRALATARSATTTKVWKIIVLRLL